MGGRCLFYTIILVSCVMIEWHSGKGKRAPGLRQAHALLELSYVRVLTILKVLRVYRLLLIYFL